MSVNENQLAEILRYSDPKKLYVVDPTNSLILLICPFKALVKANIGELNKLEVVSVDEVKVTIELITVFVVKGQAYYYFNFDIII